MRPPSPILRRAIELLQNAGGSLARDTLVAHLWPLVQPGVAYRYREQYRRRQEVRRRATGARAIKRPTVTNREMIERGAKDIIRHQICGWRKIGIINYEEGVVTLLRAPEGDLVDGRRC